MSSDTKLRTRTARSTGRTRPSATGSRTTPTSGSRPSRPIPPLHCRACPWAHRTASPALQGLEDAITVDYVDPFRGEDGWQFTPEKAGCTPDTVDGSDYLREVYVEADPDATCRVTVPVLWDKQRETIVNNESREIMRMLDEAFDPLAERDVDLNPDGYEEEVDRLIDEIYEPVNNGVYRPGFADSQSAYDEAVEELFDALDHWDTVLEDQRFLAGDRLTEADICRCSRRCSLRRRLPHALQVQQEGRPRVRQPLELHEGALPTPRRPKDGQHGPHRPALLRHPRRREPEAYRPDGSRPDFEAVHDRDELPGDLPETLVPTA